jgi:hypothetical protein
MKGSYIFLEHITHDPILKVNYTFIQYNENEDSFHILEDIIEGINCDHRYEVLTLYPKPLKGSTVADLSDDIPSVILTGKLRDMDEFQQKIVDGQINPRDIFYYPEKMHLLLENPFASPFTIMNELDEISQYESDESDEDTDSEVIILYETYTAKPAE